MSIFYIWNPIIVPRKPKTIEFVLTRGDAFGINKGTKDFLSQIFEALQIDAKVEDWKFKKYRSKYYTDYLGEKDWRDNWQIVWRAQATAEKKIGKIVEMNEPWVGIDATDDSWETAVDDDKEKVGCLVVADFDKKTDLKKAEKSVVEVKKAKSMREKYEVGNPVFAYTEMMDLYRQLQIDLGDFPGRFFAKGADYAELVMDLCKKSKGTSHFADRAE